MQREDILRGEGYSIETIWECDWMKMKSNMSNRAEIESQAKKQNIKTRDALYGGRTECFKRYVKCTDGRKIFYFDVVSLYPTVNSLDDYAVGFRKYVNVQPEDILNNRFIGLVKCDVLPPKNLYLPVLPDNDDGKLLFHLNPLFEKTYTTVELRKALQKGYKITQIHSAVEYKRFNGLMKQYVGHFIKMKIENDKPLTQTQCDEINEYHKKLGFTFTIKPENTRANPGLRKIAKLCLNALWGKFGQNGDKNDYDFHFDHQSLVKQIINNDKIIPQDWFIINENCVELRYKYKEDTTFDPEFVSEITAAFTTANARIRLYNMLDWLDDSQVIYCDTDSVIFEYDENNPKHKHPELNKKEANDLGIEFGSGLGQWESEFKKDPDEYITEICVLGAKSYAYKTNKGKTVVKQKGVTLDIDNQDRINFDEFINIIDEVITCMESAERFSIKWDEKTKNVFTQYIKRKIKSTAHEKRNIDPNNNFNTLPFGYEVN